MDKEMCQQWLKDKSINPLTGRKITENGPAYKKLEKLCAEIFEEADLKNAEEENFSLSDDSDDSGETVYEKEVCRKWNRNRTIDPITNKVILKDGKLYKSFLNRCRKLKEETENKRR